MFPENFPFFISCYFNPPYQYYSQPLYPQYENTPQNLRQSEAVVKLQSQTPKQNQQQSPKEIPKVKEIKKYREPVKRYKSPCSKQKKKKDEDFKHRQQTVNRNLKSNTLKMYFRQVRELNSETFLALYQIIEKFQPTYEVEKFISELNQRIEPNKNYISFNQIRKLCYDDQFGRVLRISMKHFFEKQIYCIGIHSIRTTRKIRLEQIRRGKEFIKSLCLQNN